MAKLVVAIGWCETKPVFGCLPALGLPWIKSPAAQLQSDGTEGHAEGRREGYIMLTIEDCIALSELTEAEILAIADHEHIPEMAAAELGNYLVQSPTGEFRIGAMIRDDIDHAHRMGDYRRAALLRICLKHFLEHHPRGVPR